MPEPIRIAVLYAEPLVGKDEKGQLHPIDILDFATERERLFDSLREAGRAVEVRVEAAMAQNLSTLVTLGCRVLHYSGHSHPNFLAFEDERGGMHALDTDMLRQLCRAGGSGGVKFAFVSACHSRKAGEALVAAGVPHVVAVRLETPVYDAAAREFARQFYLALATGKTIQQAFEIGRARILADSNLPTPAKEADKFLLLPEYANHDAAIFADATMGEVCDVTPKLPDNNSTFAVTLCVEP